MKHELVEIPIGEVGVGDWAVKQSGYNFAGTVRSVFMTGRGELRFVVDFADSGLLHIFSPSQLRFYRG